MIYLITGVPGSGKTLYAVSTLVQELARQKIKKGDQEISRRVLVDGIPDLLLPHEMMATKSQDVELVAVGRKGVPVQPTESEGHGLWNWYEWCQPGDVLVCDEVQRHWRPRGMGTAPPMEIQKLETHRHYGVDFVIITQNPMLLDQNVRRLVGRHLHVRRLLGMQRAVVYEWDGCSVGMSPKTSTARTMFTYPKSAYALYKSSELHTKQKHRIPGWVAVPVLGIAGGVFVLPDAYGTLSRAAGGQLPATQSAAVKPVQSASAPVAVLPATSASHAVGLPDDQEEKKNALAAPVELAGCIVVRERCACYDAQGKKVQVEPQQCTIDAGVTGTPPAVIAEDPSQHRPADVDALAWMADARSKPQEKNELVSLSQIRF